MYASMSLLIAKSVDGRQYDEFDFTVTIAMQIEGVHYYDSSIEVTGTSILN